jgi:hypothetical protein
MTRPAAMAAKEIVKIETSDGVQFADNRRNQNPK